MSIDETNGLNEIETVSILKNAEMFSSLSNDDLKRLAGLLRARQGRQKEVIIHQGDFEDSMYFICRGEVEVSVRNEEGAESTVARLGKGDFFGEMALLTGSPRSASVTVQKDALLLTLPKADFDDFVKDHPHLAIVFSKLLAERIRTTNQRYLHQLTREEELKKLLIRREEEHGTRLIGKTKQFQNIEKRIEELSNSDEPVILMGPEGTAAEDVARLIHLKGHRHDGPFLVVDVSGGDEWRAYSEQAKARLQGVVREDGLFEKFQMSTIFGHESGTFGGTLASRLGFLELADGGTIVLKNIDRLCPGSRERLLLFLLEKRFYRLGAVSCVEVDTRVIATANTRDFVSGEDMRDSLRGKIPELLLKNEIDLPPLALRHRDIPVIAEAFLEKHTALSGRAIKSISGPAMNILVRYAWPGNDRELENVIERGVLVCEGDTLLAEHIFLGLIPYSEKGRFNLLRFASVRKIFSNLKLRAAVQAAVVIIMIGVICSTLFGPREPEKNMAMGVIWYYWWPFLVLSFLFLGRFYCSICPIRGVTRLSRKLGSLNRSVPRIFARLDVSIAALLTLALFWGEVVFQVKEITTDTSMLLCILLFSAVVLNLFFLPEVWCRYVCPMGYFSGVCSCLAFVELRANSRVCSSQCKSTFCYKGNGHQAGCPMRILPVSLMSNQLCKMCGTCVHHCPYNSVHLDVRWPGAEIWRNKEPNPTTSLSILALLGILYPLFLNEGARFHADAPLTFTLLYLASILGAVGMFMAVSLTGGHQDWKKQMSSYGYAYLPLMFAGHLAFQLPYLFSGIDWLVAHSLSREFHPDINTRWPQIVTIIVGVIWSLWAVGKLCRKRSKIILLTHSVLLLIFGIALVLIAGR